MRYTGLGLTLKLFLSLNPSDLYRPVWYVPNQGMDYTILVN